MAKKLLVGDWMTRNPITIQSTATVMEAIHLLREKSIRRLPVMNGDQLVGLVTEKMLLGYAPPQRSTAMDQWEMHYLLSKTPITEAMNPKPYMVRPSASLADVAQHLHDRKLNGVLIVDEKGRLEGLLTTTNALEALIHFTQVISGDRRDD
jgi:acetoin utilization protein AcuB